MHSVLGMAPSGCQYLVGYDEGPFDELCAFHCCVSVWGREESCCALAACALPVSRVSTPCALSCNPGTLCLFL